MRDRRASETIEEERDGKVVSEKDDMEFSGDHHIPSGTALEHPWNTPGERDRLTHADPNILTHRPK